MPINRVSQELNQSFYFITPTIKNWYYIFDRHNRWQILADSLIYCQKHKNLEIYAYVFMLNHLHLIVRSPDVIGFLRDFKTYTSKRLVDNIRKYEPSVLELFKTDCGGYQFWKEDNQPKVIESEWFFDQKMNYIHNNPVAKGYVDRAEFWKWSSANCDSLIEIIRV
jgi:REP element-mobilizing transposase RayT